MTAVDDDAPLLLRDDLRHAALRAATAAPVLVAWALLEGARRGRAPGALSGLALAAVVGLAALVERACRRRGWVPLTTALAVWLVAALGVFAATLQLRGSGLDLLQDGPGGARIQAALGRIALDRLEVVLRLPASFGALLAGVALATDLRGRGAPRGVVVAGWLSCAGVSYPLVRLAMGGGPPREELALALLHAAAAIAVLVPILWGRASGWLAAGTERFPVRGPWWDLRDVALGGLVLLFLLAPRGGRVLEDVRRKSAAAEAERLFQEALLLDDPGAALAPLDRSLSLVDDPRVRLERGRRRAALGDVAGAEEDLEQASSPVGLADPVPGLRAEAFVAWGDVLFLDHDRALTAIQRYTRAVEVVEEDEAPLDEAGLVRHALRRRWALHAALGDDLLARRDADRLLELEFGAPEAWLRRGVLRAFVDDDGARADLARAADMGSDEAALWAAALWGEGGERVEELADRSGLVGEAARVLGPAAPVDERALLVAASASGDDALSTALAWLGARAERAGERDRARARYESALAPCARLAGAHVKRPGPGEHLGRVWAWRRLAALSR